MGNIIPIMLRHIYILLLFVVAILNCACSKTSLTTTLDNVEDIIFVDKDSAAAILDGIGLNKTNSKTEVARYNLLRALQHDDNACATIDEKTLHDALTVFENNNDEQHIYMALYAIGRLYQKKGETPKAMLAYTKAEQYAEKIDNPTYVALLHQHIAQLYRDGYDFGRALEHIKISYLHHKLSGIVYAEHRALVEMAQLLIETKRYSEAEQYLLNELQWGYENNHKEVCQSTIENLLMLYDRTDYLSKSNWLLSSEYFSMCDTTLIIDRTLAYMYALENDIKTSNRYMRRAWKKSTSINDTLNNLMQMYDISKATGEYDNALMILENVHYIHDTIMRGALQQPILSAQRDYYRTQSELHAYKLAGSRRMMVFIIIAVVLLLCILLLIAKNRIAAKNVQIERYMELADEMTKSLHAKNIEYDDMSNKLETRSAQIAGMEQQVAVLFKKQFEMLDELSSTFYETHEIKKDKDAIYRQVRENIESLVSDKKSVIQLENIVNSYRNDIMTKLRNEIPQLGENELRFLVFVYAGFSSKAISIFTKDSVGNVYTKKSRIKGVISRANTPNKQFFIDSMN